MKKKKLPSLRTDAQAEKFVATADLTEYDLGGMNTTTFEFEPKSQAVSLRLSEKLYRAAQAKARKSGMKTQQFMRKAIEAAVT